MIDKLNNIRRHWRVWLILTLALAGCVYLFHRFYFIRLPYALRGVQVDQYKTSNDLAQCLTDLDQVKSDKTAAIKAANPDLFQ